MLDDPRGGREIMPNLYSAHAPGGIRHSIPPGPVRSTGITGSGRVIDRSRVPASPSGFTLIELMIVLVVVGILAAIAIPNFLSMQDRAREARVKACMHNLQCAIEDYAVTSGGIYPTSAQKAIIRGLHQQGDWPINPFTNQRLTDAEVHFDSDPVAPGELAVNPAKTCGYRIKGYGKSGLLSLTLSIGTSDCIGTEGEEGDGGDGDGHGDGDGGDGGDD